MATTLLGLADASASMKAWQLHRTYKLKWKVESSTASWVPAQVLQTPGLPRPGDQYLIVDPGAGAYDVDVWAFFTGERSVSRAREIPEGHRGRFWYVED